MKKLTPGRIFLLSLLFIFISVILFVCILVFLNWENIVATFEKIGETIISFPQEIILAYLAGASTASVVFIIGIFLLRKKKETK